MKPTHVTIGANEISDYQFLAPLTAMIWREVIGFNPIVMVVGNWLDPKLGNISVNRGKAALKALKDHAINIQYVMPMPDLETGRTAQQCRELVGCLHLPEQDWAMPADADLWPIRKEFYQQHQSKPGRVTSYYSNGDHYQTLPTCHVTMELYNWRRLYNVNSGDDITAACYRNLHEWLPIRKYWHQDMPFTLWMADQGIVAHKVLNLPEGFEKVERRGHPPVDRIDRNGWPTEPYSLDQYVDAHMPRRPDEMNWPKVLFLFEKLLPHHAQWVREYHAEYTSLVGA